MRVRDTTTVTRVTAATKALLLTTVSAGPEPVKTAVDAEDEAAATTVVDTMLEELTDSDTAVAVS